LRRILLAVLGLAVVFSSVAAEAQTKSKNSKKKDTTTAEDNSAAPDKVLYDRAVADVKKGRHEVGRLNLQTLINTYPDSEYLAKAKLLIADSYYKEGGSANLTQAIAGYKDFIVFFPFLPEAPYAQLQVANTHYKQMDKPDRDRTEAKAAEEEFQTFLAKYPKDPLVPKAEQRLREVQEVLAEGDFRIGYYYYVKGDKRASAGRLLAITKRYPLYSRSDEALWMLGDIFEKSEKKEIASIYYQRIVRDYPLSGRVGDAKVKLVAFGVPVPQADPKALAWMQAEAAAPRPKPRMLSKPKALITGGPDAEKRRSALNGTPQMEPESEGTTVADVLSGGGKAQIAAGGATGASGNTAVVEIATPGSGASGGSTVEGGDTGTAPAAGGDANAAAPATDNQPAAAPAAGSDTSTTPAAGASQDGAAAPANGATPDPNAKPADANASKTTDPKAESTSKKKKGLRKIIPW
jgi:outer membrane protein assembly factor BamD